MRSVIAVLVLSFTLPAGAFAGKPDRGKGKKHHDDKRKADVQVTINFGTREREVFRDYFVQTHGRGGCPPGLAKKNNGCLPPGQAKKRYVVGHPLPSSVIVLEVPREISLRLGAPPRGYRYGVVDGDLVKLAVGTGLVVDAINGLVN